MMSNSTPVTPQEFFAAWKRICEKKKARLSETRTSKSLYTAEVLNSKDSVVSMLASELKLSAYFEYYSIDAILFNNEIDRVYCAQKGHSWFQNIRIAFEHENNFCAGLYQEVSHLLIMRADLRVLVSYPDNDANLNVELERLARVVAESDLAKTDPAFLFIVGVWINSGADINWRAYTYQQGKLILLNV